MAGKSPDTALDGDLACELGIEGEFDALFARAVRAGWSADEVANAMLSLAQTRIQSMRDGAFIGAEATLRRQVH